MIGKAKAHRGGAEARRRAGTECRQECLWPKDQSVQLECRATIRPRLLPLFMITSMIGRPEASEAAPYYFNYINRVTGDDILHELQSQLDETLSFLRSISEEKSLYRYAPEKWSIRQMWG